MAENKFIERLQGKGTEKSVVEIKNTATPTMFTNMPAGDSNGFNTYSDHRGNATVVANGTMNWKVDSLQTLTPANIVNGNGEDFTTSMTTSGAGLWINAEYTFPSTGDPNHPVAMVFNPQTKWVLKVCGDNLLSPTSNTIDFTVLITFGSNNIISKTFTVAEQANKFCKEFVIDFAESNTNIIKAQGLSIMKLQLLCGTADASANIYGGMTVLTCLQRKVEAVAISSTFANVEEVLRDGLLPNDYFSNGAYIAQVTDGDTAYAVFQRDGDEMLFVGWNQPIPDQTGNSGKFLMTNGSLMSWEQLTISDVDGLQDDLDDLQGQITTNKGTMDNHIANTNNPHSVTAAQAGALPNTTKYGANLSLTVDSTTYVVTAQLKDQDGNNLGTAQTIDLPLESVVVSGAYDSATKEVVLTLQDGSKIRFSVADLVSGLQTEITALNMLSADLVDDTSTTHKFVTTTEKSTWNGKQDAISDLATIRSNAQAGKAASDTIATYGDIVTHDVAEFATAAQGAKADTALQAGDNVSELVNDAGYLVMGDLTNFVTKNTAQTITGLKTFSADIVLSGTTSIKNTTSGVSYTMLYRDASGIHVGTSTQALLLAGSNARPKFNNNDVAMLSDVPTAVSQLTNDTGFITNAVNNLQNYTLTSDLATVATSGSYNDLSDKPTIPTVNNATLTIQKNGTTVQTFTANQSTNATANISVPTKTSDITNDSGFITSSALAPYALSADLATVATSGSYNDLSNKPTIPAAQVNSDWNANSGVAQILNKPTLATVATSGSYNDLSNKPTIPTVNNPTITITQGGITKGSFTLNQASGDTIALDAGGGVGNIDNITITANADDEIQAVGTVNQNTATGATNPIKSWLGDINEYNNQSVPTSNPDALCFIVDKTQTATDRYIVEAQYPDDTNGYTWYFLYSDGWVEQGGIATGTNGTITFPITMAGSDYQIMANVKNTSITGYNAVFSFLTNDLTTTSFGFKKTYNYGSSSGMDGEDYFWEVKGMTA